MRKINWKKIAAIVAILTATLLVGTVFAHVVPAEQRQVLNVFECYYEMGYDYKAHLRPNSLYGEEVGKGVTLYTKLTREVDAVAYFNASCNTPCKLEIRPAISHYLEGIIEKAGWKKPIDGLVGAQTIISEDGRSAIVKLHYDLSRIYQLIRRIENETGVMMPQYAITTVIRYDVSGESGNLSFTETKTQAIALSIIYGAGYTWERTGIIQVTGKDDNGLLATVPTIKVVKNEPVALLRMSLPPATLVVATAGTLMAILARDSEESRKPKWLKLKNKLKAMEASRLPTLEAVSLKSPKDLARIAKDYDSKIFHTKVEDKHIFFTSDGSLLYTYPCPDE
ncbi:MAG: hypothetical protein DRI48_08655 [Chloroflexi bacterium]|nr:MAG: hypothetical protein DRI48_08655 [Chloroflexota bacterium]